MQSPQYARPQEPASYATAQDQSPKTPVPKNVAFELLLDENSKVRARIPMRVQIYPHDTTDSIVTTVKNFYGIYDNHASGVSFEDENGITLIARFENLRNNMTVYVRVIPVQAYGEGYSERFYGALPLESRKRPSLGEPFQMPSLPAQGSEHIQPPSRPTSRVTNKRSASPSARSRRSASHKAGSKSRVPNAVHDDENEVYSDSEDEYGSNCSRKTKNELFASSDISMENILHDGRRKRPKFESSVCRSIFVPITSSPLSNPLCSFQIGIALVRPPSGAYHHLDVVDFPPAPVDPPRGSRIAFRPAHPSTLRIPTASFPTKLWSQ